MKIADPETTTLATELEIMEQHLPLSNSRILELGCGRAHMTRQLAERFDPKQIVATEVDRIQHEKNLLIDDLPHVSFVLGGAEHIELGDGTMDLVIMLKSLHHVPVELMDQALEEIARVLKPGGVAYISEPVYAGALNDIMRLFHDEKEVRQAAFDAVCRTIDSGRLELEKQIFFNAPGHYRNFDHFDQRMLKVTHTQHRIDDRLYEKIKQAFMQHMTQDGASFLKPSRVEILRHPMN